MVHDLRWIRIQWGPWIRIQESKNAHKNGKKFFQFSRAFGIPQIIFVFHKC
jgi:hypothetical protein